MRNDRNQTAGKRRKHAHAEAFRVHVAELVLRMAFLLLLSTALNRVYGEITRGNAEVTASGETVKPLPSADPLRFRDTIRIGQYAPEEALQRRYANAFPSLLKHIAEATTINVVPEPVLIQNFEDEQIFELPFIYVNFADRRDWTFSPREKDNLKGYLERGGFLFVDAGINAAFLRDNPELGQHHSFGEWDASPEVKEAFGTIFPGAVFQPLKRTHPLYRTFYEGLPDTRILPDTVREFVEQEKWPDGTYSAVAMTVKGRIAVLVTPIIAMGWGKSSTGAWTTTIRFRVRESTEGLGEYLQTAAYSGARFEVVREDGGTDVIFCQKQALPAWAHEPGDRWRIFRYYGSREISEFAHIFYTRLGTNILVYAMTH